MIFDGEDNSMTVDEENDEFEADSLASVMLILKFVHQALPKKYKILLQSYQRITGKLLRFCFHKNDVKFFLRSEVL